jgi:hypothetical protein
MSVRRAVARPVGTDDLLDEVGRYAESDALTSAQKVALRLHDAFLSYPAGLDDGTRAAALAHFSAPALVELTCKFVWWSTNRASVTVGDDAPHDPDRVVSFEYDADGVYRVFAD